MTPLQEKELALLKAFVAICDRLQLRYYLVCGSALGAVKYQGFIPWDDDVDVALPRKEYEIFLAEAPSMLPPQFFLQDYRSDPAFPAIFAKLRDSNTTFLEKSASRLNIHHGIYMDIFPLDGYPSGKRDRQILELRKKLYRRLLASAYLPDRFWKKVLYAPLRLAGVPGRTQDILRRYIDMISDYPPETSELWANHGNWQGVLDYAPRVYFAEGKTAVFEGMPVRIPFMAEAYLRRKYGDYRNDPPLCQQIPHHYADVVDTETPYTCYLEDHAL